MLDEIGSRQFEEWLAFREIEPGPIERLREIVKTGFAALAKTRGADVRPRDFDRWDRDDSDVITDANRAVDFLQQAYASCQPSETL